jgi:hypothetical protein
MQLGVLVLVCLLAFLLAVALSLGAVLLVPVRLHAQAQARYSTADMRLETMACIHEASWSGGLGGTNDCGGQIQVVENSRRTGESFGAALRRRMPRFAARTTDRSWVWHLRPGLREDPPGWPFRVHAQHYDAAFHSVYRRVERFMTGAEPLPCDGDPITWLGRRIDGHVIEDRLASGQWAEVDCGRTENWFGVELDID